MSSAVFVRPASSPTMPPGLRECLLIGGIVLAGFGVRAAFPARMAVEHFDEGVYASNIWFDEEQGFHYPARHLYAPPLLPWLVEWSIVFFGATHWGTMLVGVISGTLTIGLCWWLVRSLCGIAPGLIAGVPVRTERLSRRLQPDRTDGTVVVPLADRGGIFSLAGARRLVRPGGDFRRADDGPGLVHQIQRLAAVGHRNRRPRGLGDSSTNVCPGARPAVFVSGSHRHSRRVGVRSGLVGIRRCGRIPGRPGKSCPLLRRPFGMVVRLESATRQPTLF